ncbi:deoxynucleoside triphosphate triphosphohydrolase SAMHD1-like isoform X3 [Apostichopus japonicus]|uniref:deoxynucleoside triphosphate triphosphohydrolase SAMHD1-like isoform X3 n=1 Tax=Stichopus japonicus TaxID=307972 RepID=UPI003AB46F8B
MPKRRRTEETDNGSDDVSTENVPSSPKSIHIGNQVERWTELKEELELENETEVAEFLLDRADSGQHLQGTKVFNDSVHGHIEMHPLLVSIIDTPEFQRLRFIKQMGMCYFVYPGASHNRFEHSLGVSYLAGKLARSLQSKQKSLKITKEDILCVEIAGLCHDLGHGPFSHLFDEAFLPKVRPDYIGKHEKLSVDMFEHMLKKNNLGEQFKKYNLEEEDILFIKEQIFVEKKVKALRTYTPREGTELPIIKDELLTILKGENQEGFLEVVDERGKKGMVSKEMVEVKALRTYTPREGTELPIIKDELLTILKGENQEGFLEVVDERGKKGMVSKEMVEVKALRTYTPREGTELPIIKDELLTILKGENQEGFLEVVDERKKKGMVSKEMVEEIWSYKGRGKDKSYLYEIVANKRNGIDVDKWDYFARDSMHLGIQNNFDWKRYLRFARVLHGPDGSQICTRDKEIFNLYDMFHSRYSLHLRACNHRVNKILEAMIVEALKEANDYLLFPGKDGKKKKMSESIDDMEAYSKLNDHIMWKILCTTKDKFKKSRDLINRILTRDLFVCVGQTQLKKKDSQLFYIKDEDTEKGIFEKLSEETKKTIKQSDIIVHGSQLFNIKEEDAEQEIFEKLSEEAKKTIKQSDIIVHIAKFNYGMGEKDPVEHVKFYSKCDLNKSVRISEIRQDSMALPREFSERFLRVCVKQRDTEVWVREAFQKWCKGKELTAKVWGE